MLQEEHLAVLADIRAKLSVLIRDTNIPALLQCYKMADMNLHWAKWLQGEIDEIVPELEYSKE
ncbi:hypothetical protein [Desulfoscipio gibsoniae]|uniref:Uncharacterized protein n=1 Tax=Desulfoscipio gibsoniae DSM 7213 TaxID=767817 RepID=R4KBW1_9FIRM|nr:hypothetical protein [Desulfoscipio gibsoniae]AGL00039.1 hypothetical protein Desgi_0466 [Desulfoscipio gibsoniae DSM 7213]